MEGNFLEKIGRNMKDLWDKIDLNSWFEKIGIKSPEVIRNLKFFLIAFFAGYFFKKYFKFIVACAVVMTLIGVILHSQNILSINVEALKTLLHFDPSKTTLQNMFINFFAWVKNNIILFLLTSVAFLFGYKLG